MRALESGMLRDATAAEGGQQRPVAWMNLRSRGARSRLLPGAGPCSGTGSLGRLLPQKQARETAQSAYCSAASCPQLPRRSQIKSKA